jgi:hypothetical protein
MAVQIRRRHIAVSGEKAVHARALHELAREHPVERRQRERGVAHCFHRDAARAEGNHRPEHGISGDADQHFARVREAQHGLHDGALDTRLRPQRAHMPQHVVERGSDHLFVLQIEPHPADVGLVGDVRRVQLEHHRKADLACRRERRLPIPSDDGLRDGQMEGRKERLRLMLGEEVAALGQHAFADGQRGGQVRSRTLGLTRGWNLEKLRLVAPVRAQERERLDRVLRGIEVRNALRIERTPRLEVAEPCREHRLAARPRGIGHCARRGLGLRDRHR